MAASSYWSRTLQARLSRRRALAGAGGLAGAASILAACGGGSSGGGGSSDATSLVTKPVDTTKQAKRGGTLSWFWKNDPPNFDPSFGSTDARTPKNMATSLLVQTAPGYLQPAGSDVIGDLADTWEISPDKTQITFHMRQGVKWQNLAPLNGRLLDVDDVLFSWNRLLKVNAHGDALANAVNPDAPILGVTAPDAKTVVFKLKEPVSYVMVLIANQVGGNMVIVPKEADSTLDLRRTLIGTGPYMLTNYTPSVALTFKRNPDYYDQSRPFIDEVDMPIVPDYGTQLSQFRTGAIQTMPVKSQDVLAQKQDIPALNLFVGDITANTTHMAFGWLPAGKSPFLDQRVRQAYSMSWDRDLFIDTVGNTKGFEAQGLPIVRRWNSAIPCDFEGYWLDPQGKDFGPNAKYYKYDPATAKQLLSAAGYPNGFDINQTVTPSIGDANQIQILNAFGADAGFRTSINSVDLTTKYTPLRDSRGQFEGMLVKAGTSPVDPFARLAFEYSLKGGANFYGFNVNGQSDPTGDPYVEMMISKGLAEFDKGPRQQIAFDLQKYLAEKQYLAYFPGASSGFDLAWPAVGNFDVFRGGSDQLVTYWWMDDSQAPLKKT